MLFFLFYSPIQLLKLSPSSVWCLLYKLLSSVIYACDKCGVLKWLLFIPSVKVHNLFLRDFQICDNSYSTFLLNYETFRHAVFHKLFLKSGVKCSLLDRYTVKKYNLFTLEFRTLFFPYWFCWVVILCIFFRFLTHY
jgi:hypothetical protein